MSACCCLHAQRRSILSTSCHRARNSTATGHMSSQLFTSPAPSLPACNVFLSVSASGTIWMCICMEGQNLGLPSPAAIRACHRLLRHMQICERCRYLYQGLTAAVFAAVLHCTATQHGDVSGERQDASHGSCSAATGAHTAYKGIYSCSTCPSAL